MLLSIQMESSLMRPLTDPKTSNIVDYTISEEEVIYSIRDDRIMPQICSSPS
jgi:hypothetical protein